MNRNDEMQMRQIRKLLDYLQNDAQRTVHGHLDRRVQKTCMALVRIGILLERLAR